MGADRTHNHVTLYAGPHELHRAAEIDGLLALRPAARARAGSEDHGVRALHERRDVVLGLEVADHRLGAGRLEVGGMLRVANQPPAAVAARGEQPQEPQADLPVPTGHDDVHAPAQ